MQLEHALTFNTTEPGEQNATEPPAVTTGDGDAFVVTVIKLEVELPNELVTIQS